MTSVRLVSLLVLLLLPVGTPARAQAPAVPEGGDGGMSLLTPIPPPDPASPRAALRRFLELARSGDDAEAAQFLELPARTPPAEAAETARQLRVVLDRRLGVDLDRVSGLAGGDPNDGLPPDTDQLGALPVANGEDVPVRLVRRQTAQGPRWLFSSNTVGRTREWYSGVEERWLYERLPPFLGLPGPRGILVWQWGVLLLLLVATWLVGRALGRVFESVLMRFAARTATRWDDVLLASVHKPLVAACALLVYSVVVPWLDLGRTGAEFVGHALKVGVFITFFWMLLRVLDALGLLIMASPWAQTRPATRSLVPMGRRVGKVLLGAIAVVAVLNELGYPVASLIAGLGIGGLAVALAAQKTVENLFGAFSLGVDQPMREGDFVKVEDIMGTVETIGLRSTRIRTLDRTLITMPNGKLADMRIESFSVRDRLRLATDIGLAYSTTPAQMREVLAGFEAVLRAQPRLWTESLTVRFKGFSDSALLIEVMAWFEVPEWKDLQAIREEVFLQFMEVVERAGTAFATPTRTVYLVDERPPRPPTRQ